MSRDNRLGLFIIIILCASAFCNAVSVNVKCQFIS